MRHVFIKVELTEALSLVTDQMSSLCVSGHRSLQTVHFILCLDEFTCILDFAALKMVVSKSSPKMNSRGITHLQSVIVMLPRSFTMLGCFALLQNSQRLGERKERGKSGENQMKKKIYTIKYKKEKIYNYNDTKIKIKITKTKLSK